MGSKIMAEQKFGKGTEEWLMFVDYWNYCQKYWVVEDCDEYWQDLIDDSNALCKKYQDIPLARKIVFAFCETQELKHKEKNK